MKLDVRADVMNQLSEMKINATEKEINNITQRIYNTIITGEYYDVIKEAIEVEMGLIGSKNNNNLEPAYNGMRFEDPVRKDIEKNLLGGLFWWL